MMSDNSTVTLLLFSWTQFDYNVILENKINNLIGREIEYSDMLWQQDETFLKAHAMRSLVKVFSVATTMLTLRALITILLCPYFPCVSLNISVQLISSQTFSNNHLAIFWCRPTQYWNERRYAKSCHFLETNKCHVLLKVKWAWETTVHDSLKN